MRHQNSVFHSLLKHVPWDRFDGLVQAYGADARVRRLTTKSQFVAMLYAQLSGAVSLREIEAGLRSHEARLYHVGAAPARRSTLAEANAQRPAELFGDVFGLMLKQASRGLRRAMAEATYLLDSTSLSLNERSQWARFSAGVCGAKLHVVYDPDADRPTYAVVSAANVNDITIAEAMPIEPGATYVFDLGYYDFAWWAKLHAKGCRLVTRLKSNTPLHAIGERPVAAGSAILSDREGRLNRRIGGGRPNPFSDPVREICLRLETGKILRIVTNDLEASAEDIAELYKRRWGIELFFRWIKQTLRIRRFVGTSENAIRIQVAVALIAFLLLRLAQATQSAIDSPLTFARLVRINLMNRRHLHCLLSSDPPTSPNQLALEWGAT